MSNDFNTASLARPGPCRFLHAICNKCSCFWSESPFRAVHVWISHNDSPASQGSLTHFMLVSTGVQSCSRAALRIPWREQVRSERINRSAHCAEASGYDIRGNAARNERQDSHPHRPAEREDILAGFVLALAKSKVRIVERARSTGVFMIQCQHRNPSRFLIEIDQEDDGRWIAKLPSLPGVLAYGQTQDEAILQAQILAFRVIADRLEQGGWFQACSLVRQKYRASA